MSRFLPAAIGIYRVCVGAFIVYIWLACQTRGATPQWLVYWCVIAAGLAAMPKIAIAGPCLYVLLAYGMSSNVQELDLMLSARILDGAALLILAGWLLAGPKRSERLTDSPGLVLLGCLFFAWIALTLAVALMRGTPYGTFLRHDPSGWLQAAVLLVVTSDVVRTRRDCTVLATIITATVIGRAALQGLAGIYLESYIATLLVVGVPLALLGMLLAQERWLRLVFGCGAAAMVGLLTVTQNRAAAVAAVATLVALLWQSRRAGFCKWLGAAIILAVPVLVFAPSHYLDRFRSLVNPAQNYASDSLDRSTAQERLQLWTAGLEMALDQPLWGVGPGNYPVTLGMHLPGKGLLNAHSNYVQMLAETGFAGLFLYSAFFVGTLFMLGRIRGNGRVPWHRAAAQMLQLALVAYLVGGIFNSRHDFVLAYVLVGWALAVARLESTPAGARGTRSTLSGSAS